MNHNLLLIFLLLSRLPIYCFVVFRAFKYRHSMLIISSNWLGAVGFFGALGAMTNVYGSKVTSNIIGTMFAFSLFGLAFTAKELKRVKE